MQHARRLVQLIFWSLQIDIPELMWIADVQIFRPEAMHNDVVIYVCDYKQMKVCCRVFQKALDTPWPNTDGATKPGRKMGFENAKTRDNPWLEVDVLDQVCQFDLRMEKHWVIHDGSFDVGI